MYDLKRDDIVKIIISASEINNKNREKTPYEDKFEYQIDISFYTRTKRESFIDISYSITSDSTKKLSLKEEIEKNIKIQMEKLGVKKYSIIETNVDTAEGYGRELIKIEEHKQG